MSVLRETSTEVFFFAVPTDEHNLEGPVKPK